MMLQSTAALCLALIIGASAVAAAPAEAPSPSDYASKYAWIDFDILMESPRFLTSFIKCLLRKGPCSPEGRILRRLMPEIVATDCARCSPEQVVLARRIVKYIQDNRQEEFRLLQKIYDPKGIHEEHFRAFIDGRPPPRIEDLPLVVDSSIVSTSTTTWRPPPPPSTTTTPRPPPPPPTTTTSRPPPPSTTTTTWTPPSTTTTWRPPPPSTTTTLRPPPPSTTTWRPPPPSTTSLRPQTPPPPPPPPPPTTTWRPPPPTPLPTTTTQSYNIQPDNFPNDNGGNGGLSIRATGSAQAGVNLINKNNEPPISSTVLPQFYVKFESPILNVFSELKLGVRQAAANLQVQLG